MRKIILILFVFVIVATVTTGCSQKSDYQIFKEALERTEAVEKGKAQLELDMKIEFNKEGLSEDETEFMEFLEEFKLSLKDEFNREKKESLKKIFIQTKDMGFDAKVYIKDKTMYIITPIIPKILVVEDNRLAESNSKKTFKEGTVYQYFPKLSENSIKQLKKLWNDLYNEENVSSLKNIVLDTPEGKAKARKFEIKLKDEQLKPAIKKVMEIILMDEQFRKGLAEVMESSGAVSVEEILQHNMKAIDQATINNFNQHAYIDRDNYVIEETVNMDMTFPFSKPGTPRNYHFEMKIKRWDLNKEPEIYFPEVTQENSINLEELKKEKFDELFKDM